MAKNKVTFCNNGTLHYALYTKDFIIDMLKAVRNEFVIFVFYDDSVTEFFNIREVEG